MSSPTSTGNNPRGTNGNGNGAPAATTTTSTTAPQGNTSGGDATTAPQGNTGGEQPAPQPTNNAATTEPAPTNNNAAAFTEDEEEARQRAANIKLFNSIPKRDVGVGEVGYTFVQQFGTKFGDVWYVGKVVQKRSRSRVIIFKDGDRDYYDLKKLKDLKQLAGRRNVPDDDIQESSDEEDGGVDYTMTELISFDELKKRSALKCDGKSESGGRCKLSAFSKWKGTDGDVFNPCVDCAEE